ncbi:hypothetical protein [Peribacillus simplex]|uniref:hypothetical protein n=1 Tax=Peribacillus simplex TaxID=1478 RepID=UPI0024C1DB5F|nr:hypothetical protein [Peribacillus simplex]WHY98852.1 hypothetical protein QNH37_06710 [Peribacillus simplex]
MINKQYDGINRNRQCFMHLDLDAWCYHCKFDFIIFSFCIYDFRNSDIWRLSFSLMTFLQEQVLFLNKRVALAALFLMVLTSKKILYGIMIVSVGLGLLTIKDDFSISIGSIYCLLAAFLYAIHIIVTNYFVKEVDALQLAIFQLGFATLYATIGTFIF